MSPRKRKRAFDSAASSAIVGLVARIAFVIPDLRGGGAEHVALTLVNAFVRKSHELDLVVMRDGGELRELLDPKVRLFNLGAPRIRNVLWPLMRYFKERRPDTVLVSMWPLTVIAIIASRLAAARHRLVLSDHAVLSQHYPPSVRSALHLTIRLFYPLADARVAVSGGAARDLARLSRLNKSMFEVIANPIDFPRELQNVEEVDTLWGDAKKRILTVGALVPVKEHAFLIRAISLLPLSLGARLVIVGTGPLEQELRQEAAAFGAGDRLIFAGYAHNPWPFYASADLFILGSREESFGNVLVEALFAGLPIVSAANIGSAEVLEHGKYGTIVESHTPGQFAAAVEEALTAPLNKQLLRARAIDLSGESILKYQRLLLGAQ